MGQHIYLVKCVLNKGEQEFHSDYVTDSPYDEEIIKEFEAATRKKASEDKKYPHWEEADDLEFDYDIIY